ncbi:MAG: DUF554 domain-containing protein [Spirochaetales bacterium]|nr:DUF554 domain-containing protein [Spirochaetales bacterium]
MMPFPLGTIINVSTVLLGSLFGLLLHKGIPEKYKKILFQAIGLFTLMIAVNMVIKVRNPLVVIFSLIVGGFLGELAGFEAWLEAMSDKLASLFKTDKGRFSQGLLSAFLLFCVGSMTLVGAIDEGLRQDSSLLMTKAILDGFVSVSLASSLGFGVLFSVIPLFIFQYGITLAAFFAQDIFSPYLIDQLTALGGVMILGLGIGLLDIKKLKVSNLLPSILILVILTTGLGGLDLLKYIGG